MVNDTCVCLYINSTHAFASAPHRGTIQFREFAPWGVGREGEREREREGEPKRFMHAAHVRCAPHIIPASAARRATPNNATTDTTAGISTLKWRSHELHIICRDSHCWWWCSVAIRHTSVPLRQTIKLFRLGSARARRRLQHFYRSRGCVCHPQQGHVIVIIIIIVSIGRGRERTMFLVCV